MVAILVPAAMFQCVLQSVSHIYKDGGSYCLYHALKMTEEERRTLYEITFPYRAFNQFQNVISKKQKKKKLN